MNIYTSDDTTAAKLALAEYRRTQTAMDMFPLEFVIDHTELVKEGV